MSSSVVDDMQLYIKTDGRIRGHVVMAVKNTVAAHELIRKWLDEWSGKGLPLNIEETLDIVHVSKEGNVFEMLAAMLWLGNVTYSVVDDNNHMEPVINEVEFCSFVVSIGLFIQVKSAQHFQNDVNAHQDPYYAQNNPYHNYSSNMGDTPSSRNVHPEYSSPQLSPYAPPLNAQQDHVSKS